jgi:hypothetical protein
MIQGDQNIEILQNKGILGNCTSSIDGRRKHNLNVLRTILEVGGKNCTVC